MLKAILHILPRYVAILDARYGVHVLMINRACYKSMWSNRLNAVTLFRVLSDKVI